MKHKKLKKILEFLAKDLLALKKDQEALNINQTIELQGTRLLKNFIKMLLRGMKKEANQEMP